ncbi:MAG: hypothetical protein M2R45_03189 [Verrucomicrobia subdivision 3 bacterium]|nr:hypothetical protein [Limisphaerales bacterium]MCS1413904.1 hypothetical protein [Limisphaerales bacterium]
MPMKRYDFMHDVNGLGTFLCSKYCLPHLVKLVIHIFSTTPRRLIWNPEGFRGMWRTR